MFFLVSSFAISFSSFLNLVQHTIIVKFNFSEVFPSKLRETVWYFHGLNSHIIENGRGKHSAIILLRMLKAVVRALLCVSMIPENSSILVLLKD